MRHLQVLTVKELAAQLGVCPAQVRKMAKRGMPHQRTGDNGKYLFSAEAINEWLGGENHNNKREAKQW